MKTLRRIPIFLLSIALTLSSITGCKKDDKIETNVITDQDGNQYKTIVIGTQTWMAENLKTTKYRNGDPIEQIPDETAWSDLSTSAYCWYNNDGATYKATYGALYNWHAISDARNICPTGWHIPTDDEWTILIDYLGGLEIAGGKMKQTGTLNWTDPNTDATNEGGFNAVPCSYRNIYGVFSTGAFLKNAYWWSNSSINDINSWYYGVSYNSGSSTRVAFAKNAAFSVRCIKD